MDTVSSEVATQLPSQLLKMCELLKLSAIVMLKIISFFKNICYTLYKYSVIALNSALFNKVNKKFKSEDSNLLLTWFSPKIIIPLDTMSLQLIAIYDGYSPFSVPDVRELNQQPMNQYLMNSFFTVFNSYNLSWKRSIKTCTLPRNVVGSLLLLSFLRLIQSFIDYTEKNID